MCAVRIPSWYDQLWAEPASGRSEPVKRLVWNKTAKPMADEARYTIRSFWGSPWQSYSMLKSISVIFLLPLFALANPNRGADLLSKLPMRFEANRGQWPAEVRFATRSAERGMVLADGGEVRIGALKVRPFNANRQPRVEGVNKLSSGATYLIGRDKGAWRGNVPSFSAVAYRGVYPGIDLLYKGEGRRVEYDFVLAPNANPAAIRMEFAGASRLEIAGDGSLVVIVAGREELRQPIPFAYQEDAATGTRTQIDAHYQLLAANQVSFKLGPYDARRALTIDPVLVATYFGGNGVDVATAVAVDAQNQVWVAGYTTSTTLPLTDNPYAGQKAGTATDIFVAKFNPNVSGADSLVWATYLGGDNSEKPTAMTLSGDGFIYLTGDTTSTNFPLAGTPAQGALKGNTDAFLVRLSRSQQGIDALWYSTYLGGDGKDFGTAVAFDARNRPYIAGYSTTSAGFPFVNALQTSIRGGYDAFFASFNPDSSNTLAYSSFLGGGATDVATGIVVDRNGIVHLTGYTMSQDFPYTDGAYRTEQAGRGDIFYARADISRAGLDGYLYGTYIGGSDTDLAYGLAQDSAGGLYVTGYTFSDDFPIVGSPVRGVRAGSADAFLLRIDPSAPGSNPITYSTYLGGSGAELAYGISVSANNRVAITGYTGSTDFPALGGPLQPKSGGAIDAYLSLIDFSGAVPTLIYSSYVGGDSPDFGYQVAQDGRGNIYAVGSTISRRFASPGVFQLDLSRYTDSYLVRVNLCENPAACEAQGLVTPRAAGKPGVNAAAAEADSCLAPAGPSLSLAGATCAESAEGSTLCTRKVCSADLLE